MPYLTPTEAAARFRVTRAYIIRLAKAGRIPGAEKVGRHWAIPEDWVYVKFADRAKDTTK